MKHIWISAPMVFALMSCGGNTLDTSGGPTPVTPGGGGSASFSELISTGQALYGEHWNQGITGTTPSNGTATYNGIAHYSTIYSNPQDIVNGSEVASEIQIIANFGNNTLSGTAYNFVSCCTTKSGTLSISGGSISGNTFEATLSGNTMQNGNPGTYSGSISGEFSGPGAEGLRGTGDAIGDYPALGVLDVNIVFIAEQ